MDNPPSIFIFYFFFLKLLVNVAFGITSIDTSVSNKSSIAQKTEREGFEPSVPLCGGTHDFQSCSFGLSDISPYIFYTIPYKNYTRGFSFNINYYRFY